MPQSDVASPQLEVAPKIRGRSVLRNVRRIRRPQLEVATSDCGDFMRRERERDRSERPNVDCVQVDRSGFRSGGNAIYVPTLVHLGKYRLYKTSTGMFPTGNLLYKTPLIPSLNDLSGLPLFSPVSICIA
jgi:hypothetical protein